RRGHGRVDGTGGSTPRHLDQLDDVGQRSLRDLRRRHRRRVGSPGSTRHHASVDRDEGRSKLLTRAVAGMVCAGACRPDRVAGKLTYTSSAGTWRGEETMYPSEWDTSSIERSKDATRTWAPSRQSRVGDVGDGSGQVDGQAGKARTAWLT